MRTNRHSPPSPGSSPSVRSPRFSLRNTVRVAVGAIVPIAMIVLSSPAKAAVITVDENCTLVDAITSANTDTATGGCVAGDAGEDILRLTSDVVLTEVDNDTEGPSGLPVIESEIRIRGHGFEISRNSNDDFRLFLITSGGYLTIVDTILRNGVTNGVSGGTVLIENGADANLIGVSIYDGVANGGGAIRIDEGNLTIFDSLLENNTATFGGAISSIFGTLFALNTDIVENQATSGISGGGGIDSLGSEIDLVESSVNGNSALRYAGVAARSGVLRIDRSTISNNTATSGQSGGLDISFSASATITNSTFFGNSGPEGSAIRAGNAAEALALLNTTIIGNSSYPYSEAALDARRVDILDIENTVVASNLDINCKGVPLSDRGNVTNAFDDSCPGFGFNLFFHALGDHGGPTPTCPLYSLDSQIDAGGDCGLAIDQRRYGRVDGACDSGSYEHDGVPPPTLTVNGTCPGTITLEISEATPNSSVTLVRGERIGRSEIPGGACAGTEHLLETTTVVTTIGTDANGEATLQPTLSLDRCRNLLQVVDTETCLVSTVERFPSF